MIKRLLGYIKRPEAFLFFFGLIIFSFCLVDKSLHRSLFLCSLPMFLIYGTQDGFLKLIFKNRLFQLLTLLGVFYVFSNFWASPPLDTGRGFGALKGFVLGSIFLVAVARYLTTEKTESFFTVFIVGICLSVLFSILISYAPLFFDSKPIPYRPGMIFRGENPNIAGFFIGLGMISMACCSVQGRSMLGKTMKEAPLWAKASLGIIIVTFFAALMLTQSRSVIGGVVVSVLLIAALRANYKMLIAGGVLIVGVIAVLFSGVIDARDMIERGFNARIEVWTESFHQALENPFLGNGAASNVKIVVERTHEVQSAAHNIFLGVFYDVGIIGLSLFLCVYAMAALKAFKLRDVNSLPLVLLVFGAAVGLFEFHSYFLNLNREWLVWWLPLGIILGLELRKTV